MIDPTPTEAQVRAFAIEKAVGIHGTHPGDTKLIATAQAIADFVRGKGGPSQESEGR